jgi:hypothetical protein
MAASLYLAHDEKLKVVRVVRVVDGFALSSLSDEYDPFDPVGGEVVESLLDIDLNGYEVVDL